MKKLSQEVSLRAKKRGLISNSISITLKYTRVKSKTKQTIIDLYTNDSQIIYSTALLLFEEIYQGEMLRLVGVSLNNVIQQENLNLQMSLFDYDKNDPTSKQNETDIILENLNSSFTRGKTDESVFPY